MKKIKLIAFAIASALTLSTLSSQAQISTPRPSPAGSVSTTVGLTDIEISYFRPQMKGRKIFGEGSDFLVPFGQKWRAGANSGTVITFGDDVKVAGQNVPAGEYLLILTPSASEWEIILYSDKSLGANVNGTEADKITVQTKVATSPLTEAVQTLTYQITDLSENSQNANIQMAWENTAINIPVEVSFDEEIMASIAKNTVVNPGNYAAAARYYYDTDRDMDQALEWINAYLAAGDNNKQFWNIYLKAQILAKKGDKKNAIKTAKQSKELATASPNGDFGYIKKNDELIASLK
ncbi:hypothetical protein BFP72_08805 [Reichenbachiella sp. 5M10]|uniref:DUF2911 domain-containing protein n=1 Tax=Reichenbachiella sp. 5M10 TaxID=1889772 RepID=UPI000C14ABA2|nr:DUF2911 domain-containing protein [Reichenbachiella sp. 5M10]PIB35484.1 hypothetical protein BFP72_08805 [Reichenbachiella sp. 5M10]